MTEYFEMSMHVKIAKWIFTCHELDEARVYYLIPLQSWKKVLKNVIFMVMKQCAWHYCAICLSVPRTFFQECGVVICLQDPWSYYTKNFILKEIPCYMNCVTLCIVKSIILNLTLLAAYTSIMIVLFLTEKNGGLDTRCIAN